MRAEDVYVDPSALARLYIHQEGSREMCAWRLKVKGTLQVTHHGRIEVVNAVCRAAFMRQITAETLADSLKDFSSDFAAGHLHQADILWRSALNRAAGLSQRYTPTLGTRSLDVLHVACALELKLGHFLTFDARQQQLAVSVGLKTVPI